MGALFTGCVSEPELSETAAEVQVTWANVVGATATGNNLVKTAANGWGNSGASSTQSFSTDTFVEWTTSERTTGKAVGLSLGDTTQHFNDIDFAIVAAANGTFQAVENGLTVANLGTYNANDVFRIESFERTVRYFRNGTVVFTSSKSPQYPLLADAALFHTNATINNANIDFFTFRNPAGVDLVAPGTLRKTVGLADQWNNSGAISTRAIQADTGFLEFTGGETTHGKAAGLSSTDPNTHFNTIDFGILLGRHAPNAAAQVFENGALRFTDSVNWQVTDVFRVEVELDPVTDVPRVVYKKNGAVMFTSTQPVVYPLFGDFAIFHDGGTLQNVAITDTFWANIVGGEGIGNNLYSDTTTGGATSVASIPNGDGFVEFGTREINRGKAVGLSNGNTNSSLADIDFAIVLSANSNAFVFENGVQRAALGAYTPADVFRVAVSGNVVRYFKNGAVVFTSTRTPTFPLIADVALLSVGATVRNAAFVVESQDSIPRDAVSGFAVPLTQADWDAVFTAAGVTQKIVNQSWGMQDVSGNPVAAIGTPLTAAAGLDYRQVVTGWDRRAISFGPDAGSEYLFQQRTVGPDSTTTSTLMFGYIQVDAPAGSRRVLVISGGSTGNILLSVNAAGQYRLIADQVESLGTATVTGAVRPVILQLDRTNSVVRVYTDQEIISATAFPALINNSTRGWGTSNNNGTSGVQHNLLGAQFAGIDAEWTEAETRAIMNVLIDGTVPW